MENLTIEYLLEKSLNSLYVANTVISDDDILWFPDEPDGF